MIIPSQALTERLATQGISGDATGAIEFDGEGTVFRRRLIVDAAAVDAEISLVCLRFTSAEELAAFAAGHLAEQGVAPLLLKPAAPWETQLNGATRAAWDAALGTIGIPASDPALQGNAAIELAAGQTALPRLIQALIANPQRADALLLADAPLVITVTASGQVWFTSNVPTLLPTIEVPVS